MPSKVHITIKRQFLHSDEDRDQVLDQVSASGLRRINTKRLPRYGLLTGYIAEQDIQRLKDLEPVEAVERDEEVRAI